MLKRKIYADLLEWKGRPHRPLVISGQRQVGKTFIIREFAKNEYECLIELNFSENTEDKEIFKGSVTADSVIKRISVSYPDRKVIPGKTLLFLDEIQDCKEAYASLKHLSDDDRFDVIASGSMLGVRMPNLKDGPDGNNVLIPMGYEECITMFSLDFEEFLWAKGISDGIIAEVRTCIRDRIPIDGVILSKMEAYYREFMIVGGMPASVSAFVESGDFTGVRKILSELNMSCVRDINRYNNGLDIIKTTECYESIPDQLAYSNKKFMYSRINGAGSRKAADRYKENILWIKGAGYGIFCYSVVDMSMPLKSRRDSFKIYQSDTGMLINRYGDNCLKAVYDERTDYNLGAVTENAVAEGLIKSGYLPRYHSITKGEDRMELDFVIETGDGLCVIEVKSGKKRDAPSLSKAMAKYSLARKIMLEKGNIRMGDDGVEHYPLFTACFMREIEPEWDGPAI